MTFLTLLLHNKNANMTLHHKPVGIPWIYYSPDKSKFIPSKGVTCFGFIINSETIAVKLTAEKS